MLFAKDGEIYNIEGTKHLVIGGAYSVDKFYRLAHNYGWWPDEQPTKEIREIIKQISSIANNVNQIARAVNATKYIDGKGMEKMYHISNNTYYKYKRELVND